MESVAPVLDRVEQARIRARKWHADNRERANERSRRYGAEHAEEKRQHAIRWYQQNKESQKVARAARNATQRAKEEQRRWKADNKERVAALKRNYKLRKRQAEGTHTGEDIKRLFAVQRGLCVYCATGLSNYHVDHIIPLSSGGSNYPSNLQLLCAPCNLSKSAQDPIAFAQKRGFLI